jgi:hypothetical protein
MAHRIAQLLRRKRKPGGKLALSKLTAAQGLDRPRQTLNAN